MVESEFTMSYEYYRYCYSYNVNIWIYKPYSELLYVISEHHYARLIADELPNIY